LSTCSRLDEGDIGNSGLGNHAYSPDLAHSDFHLYGPMKVHLRGQKFQTDDEFKPGVLNLLFSQDKTFYAAGISNLLGQWKKYVSVEGEYLEKE
jgi:hypothetical protein